MCRYNLDKDQQFISSLQNSTLNQLLAHQDYLARYIDSRDDERVEPDLELDKHIQQYNAVTKAVKDSREKLQATVGDYLLEPNGCPICQEGEGTIERQGYVIIGKELQLLSHCVNCGQNWTDNYKLDSVSLPM